jgi:hypothetical protein
MIRWVQAGAAIAVLLAAFVWMAPQAMSMQAADEIGGAGTCQCCNKKDCPDYCNASDYFTAGTAKDDACDCKLKSSDPCGDEVSGCKSYQGMDSGNMCNVGNC